MTHTPELLRVIEQNELDKTSRCVRLVDSNSVFAFAVDEKYGDRISALWNMAERLGLTTEEIESGNVETKLKTAPDMLEALEQTYATIENRLICPFCGCALDHRHDCIAILIQTAIKKARGEE